MNIEIMEVGPREGFQFERGEISSQAKASLINALSQTGVAEIQAVSFVSKKAMPHVADAEAVMAMVAPVAGVDFVGLWFSPNGFERAAGVANLTLHGLVTTSASLPFTQRNWNTDEAGFRQLNLKLCALYAERNLPIHINVAAAFGCNFAGPVAPATVMRLLNTARNDAAKAGLEISEIALADTMAWANPASIKALCRDVLAEIGDIPLRMHLHDTRGLGIANALAAIELGITRFDTAIAGLGGCPFAGHKGAAGNIATEDFYYMCESLGLKTGLIPDKLIAAGKLAEQVVGHNSSSRTLKGGFAPLEMS